MSDQPSSSDISYDAEEPMSYVAEVGEWKTRKISLIGVAKSFVSQLTVGQDLTRVTLPSVFLHPYSMLEVICWRYLIQAPMLYGINQMEDPEERFMQVLRRYLGFIRQEDFEKKPYNPVLGESHTAWIDSEKYGRTTLVSEQVSHHPPIAAFVTTNDKEKTVVEGNISFNVKFGGNSVSVTTEGKSFIHLPDHDEIYEMSKGLPDMIITNVILGTKRVFWDGDVSLSCPKTGYHAKMTLKNASHKNIVEGIVSKGDVVLYSFSGRCGEVVSYWPFVTEPTPTEQPAQGNYYFSKFKSFATPWLSSQQKPDRDLTNDKVLVDISQFDTPKVHYLPFKDQDDFSSFKVWRDVTKNIIINDMGKADTAKKTVEDAQRKRVAEAKAKGQKFDGKYFYFDEDKKFWIYRKQDNSELRTA
jgi:hypothetical protein